MRPEPSFWQKVLLALRFLGPEGTRRALFYALWRDYWNRKEPAPRSPWRPVGPPRSMVVIPGGSRFLFPEGELEVVFLEGGLRLTWTPGRLPPPYAIEKAPALLEPERQEEGGRFALRAGGSASRWGQRVSSSWTRRDGCGGGRPCPSAEGRPGGTG